MVPACRRCGQLHDPYAGCPAVQGQPPPAYDARWPSDIEQGIIGATIAERYAVDGLLGHGVTGATYAVHHVGLGRPAVLKILRPRHAGPDLVTRVLHGETRAAWCVTHAGICDVLDAGTLADGSPWFVMERLDGEPLSARVARERLSLAAAVDMTMQLLSTLDAIHARELIARDIRPRNVFLVSRRGCRPLLKLLDFGLARLLPVDRLRETGPAGLTSIVPYLSPERTRGEHGVDAASDLYSAALLFYEALSGEPAYAGATVDEVVRRIVQGGAPPLFERRADVSDELSAFVARSLSPDPSLRHGSAQEMQDELRALFDGSRKGISLALATGRHAPVKLPEPAPPPVAPPPPTTTARPDTPSVLPSLDDDGYADDTQTKKATSLLSALRPLAEEMGLGGGRFDEASAENADRTVPPPPPEIEIDASSFEDSTLELRARGLPILVRDEPPADEGVNGPVTQRDRPPREDDRDDREDETETMQLHPELRARVEQMLADPKVPSIPIPGPPSVRKRP